MDQPHDPKAGAARGPRPRQAAVGFILVSVWLDVLSLGVIIPAFPKLVQHFQHGDAAAAGFTIGLFGSIWCVAQFFGGPIQGALSDRFGRRPVLLLSMVGLGLDYLVMAIAPNLLWLLVGRIISGVTSATYSIANAYVADVTPPDQRAARFGLLSAAFGIGFITGPAIGGLLGGIDPRLPFWGAAGLCLLNALYGAFVLPESLPADRRAKFSFHLANPVGSFDLYRARPGLLALAAILFLHYLTHQVLQSTWVPYTTYRYAWSTQMTGVSLALVGVSSIVTQVLVVPRAVARFGERGTLYAGLIAAGLGFAAFAWAPTTAAFMLLILPFGLMGLVNPGLNGLMSRRVADTEQGRLQGANMGLMAIGGLVGPILFTEVFADAIGRWSAWAPVGSPFYLAAILEALGLALALSVTRVARQPAPAE
jgi:DHA1 family tetracycline resistance protein-like MFS transporter